MSVSLGTFNIFFSQTSESKSKQYFWKPFPLVKLPPLVHYRAVYFPFIDDRIFIKLNRRWFIDKETYEACFNGGDYPISYPSLITLDNINIMPQILIIAYLQPKICSIQGTIFQIRCETATTTVINYPPCKI